MNEGVTDSHSLNSVGNGNCGDHQNRHESVCAASMIYHPRNRPSNGYMQYADIQLSRLGSKQ